MMFDSSPIIGASVAIHWYWTFKSSLASTYALQPRSSRGRSGEKIKMAKTIRLLCITCGRIYQCDNNRSARIHAMPNRQHFIDNYVCKACIAKGATVQPTVSQMTGQPKPRRIRKKINLDITEGFKPQEEIHVPEPAPIIEPVKVEIPFEVEGEFDEDVKQYVPTSCERYVTRKFGDDKKTSDEDILKFHFKAKNPLMKNVLFIGETGTGKTLAVRHFCHKYKIPYHRVVMNGGTTVEDIVGQNVMDADGKFKFEFQVLIKFMQKGGIFVFDEINAGQKEILHILNSITDFERMISATQHKGEVIRACDNFMVVACMNPPSEYDLQDMSKSLKSRFCSYYFDYDESIDKEVTNNDKKLIEFARAVRLARVNKQIDTPLATRDLLQFQAIRDSLGYDMAKEMIINKFKNEEKNVIKTMVETMLEKSQVLKDREGQ